MVEPDDSDGVSNEDSGFTSVRGAFARQSTSNSLQIPGETAAVLKVAEPEVCTLFPAPQRKLFWWQDSETLSEVETFPNYDSSDGEIVASRDPSRNHSLTSSGCHR